MFLGACQSPQANNGFEAWKENFASYALTQNISQDTIEAYVTPLQKLEHVISSDKKQPEFQLSWTKYIQSRLSEERIKTGQKILQEYKKELIKTQEKYHVPAHILVAFWGLETNYGQIKGNVDVLNALATLAYDQRRSKFFTHQLIVLLNALEKEQLSPPRGSWAGAFGHFQFIPTTYSKYAIDGDSDGQKDIVQSFPDALASAAHYLSKMGWDDNILWGREAVISEQTLWHKIDFSKRYSLLEWEKMGVQLKRKKKLSPFEQKMTARLILPAGSNGNAFLVYKNFEVIKKWNNSDFYALSVSLLSDSIRSGRPFHMPYEEQSIKHEEIKSVQEKLVQLNYYTNTPDGIMGSKTKESIQTYQKQNNLIPDGYLSKELLEKILK